MTFYDAGADGSNGIIQATMVRVQFAAAAPAPRILEVTTTPRLRNLEGWLELPQGAGKVVLTVKATNAQRVRFTLTPTGTETGPYGKLLGEDRDPSDGFHLVWRYPNDPLLAHLGIEAVGPGGTGGELLTSCIHSPRPLRHDRRHDHPWRRSLAVDQSGMLDAGHGRESATERGHLR